MVGSYSVSTGPLVFPLSSGGGACCLDIDFQHISHPHALRGIAYYCCLLMQCMHLPSVHLNCDIYHLTMKILDAAICITTILYLQYLEMTTVIFPWLK